MDEERKPEEPSIVPSRPEIPAGRDVPEIPADKNAPEKKTPPHGEN